MEGAEYRMLTDDKHPDRAARSRRRAGNATGVSDA